MTLAVALAMLSLGVVAWLQSRSLLSPAVVYAVYWGFVVASSGFVAFGDHRLSEAALLVFLLGAAAFTAGAATVHAAWRPRLRSPERLSVGRKRVVQNVMFAYSIGLLMLLPSFVASIRAAGAALQIDDFSTAARMALSLADRGGVPHYFQSATSVGAFFSFYAAWVYEGGTRDKLALGAATLATLVMSAATFARSPVVALLLGVLAILALRRHVSSGAVAVSFLTTLILALAIGSVLNKGPDFGGGTSTARAIAQNLGVYFVGGPLGFSEVMRDPGLVGQPGLSLRFFIPFAGWLGWTPTVPENVLDYLTTDLGNVYTFYYPYWFDAGWVGVVACAFVAGVVSTMIFLAARSGYAVAGAAYGYILGAVATSAVGDGFFSSPTPWILLVGLGWVLWHLPVRHARVIPVSA
jgi:oligosaccharide repeat unit polymerase